LRCIGHSDVASTYWYVTAYRSWWRLLLSASALFNEAETDELSDPSKFATLLAAFSLRDWWNRKTWATNCAAYRDAFKLLIAYLEKQLKSLQTHHTQRFRLEDVLGFLDFLRNKRAIAFEVECTLLRLRSFMRFVAMHSPLVCCYRNRILPFHETLWEALSICFSWRNAGLIMAPDTPNLFGGETAYYCKFCYCTTLVPEFRNWQYTGKDILLRYTVIRLYGRKESNEPTAVEGNSFTSSCWIAEDASSQMTFWFKPSRRKMTRCNVCGTPGAGSQQKLKSISLLPTEYFSPHRSAWNSMHMLQVALISRSLPFG